MSSLTTSLAALSKKADKLLEIHHQELFALGLDVSFNRATLATKYWLPLPGSNETEDQTEANEDTNSRDESDEQLLPVLRECELILEWCEKAALSKPHEIMLPTSTSAFAQSVRKISRMIDARRQSSGSDSESSPSVSTALYTQNTSKAAPEPQPHGRISPPRSISYGTHHLTRNTQTFEPKEFDIKNRPQSSGGDEKEMLSSPRGSQTQRYPPKPEKDDTSQSPYSYKYPMRYQPEPTGTYNIPGALLSPGRMSPGNHPAPEYQYGHIPGESETRSAILTVHDHTTYNLDPGRNEYLPSKIDPSGETKVSKDGHPLDGRRFRCRTFELPFRGNTLFMLSKECRSVLGYRDHGLMFKNNDSLFKIIVTQTEKEYLVRRNIIPKSSLSREITVVTARSMFRQFGARLIQDGHHVQDDYWEAEARKQGLTEEDAARPDGEKGPGAAKAKEDMVAQNLRKEAKELLRNLNSRA